MSKKVLSPTQTTGPPFFLSGGEWFLQVEDHPGGTITLQFKGLASPRYIDSDVVFSAGDDGRKFFYASRESSYRVTASTVGASVFVLSGRDSGEGPQ